MAIKRTKKTPEVSVPTEAPTPVKKRATVAHRSTRTSKVVPAEQAEKALAPVNITQEVAQLAYYLWLGRGAGAGNPDEDWFRAEKQIRAKYGIQP